MLFAPAVTCAFYASRFLAKRKQTNAQTFTTSMQFSAPFGTSRTSLTLYNSFWDLTLKTQTGPHNSIIVARVCRHPSADASSFDHLAGIISLNCKMETIILGDLNSDWLNKSSNYLQHISTCLNFFQLINEPIFPSGQPFQIHRHWTDLFILSLIWGSVFTAPLSVSGNFIYCTKNLFNLQRRKEVLEILMRKLY